MDLENRIPVRNGKGMSAPRDEDLLMCNKKWSE